MAAIAPVELKFLLEKDPHLPLVDVRTPAEYKQLHVPSAVNVPLNDLTPERLEAAVGLAARRPFYILCRSGARAEIAAARLASAGHRDGIVVTGGTLAWQAAGFPVIRGASGAVSLERQVRIVSGLCVLAGIVLAWFVAPGFVWLSALVGAGLIMAGITEWCGLGLLLAKAPWNQIRS